MTRQRENPVDIAKNNLKRLEHLCSELEDLRLRESIRKIADELVEKPRPKPRPIPFSEAISRVKCRCNEHRQCFGCRKIRELIHELEYVGLLDLDN